MKIATTNITTHVLELLSCRGTAWFHSLCQDWRQRTGYHPVQIAEHVARVAARKKRWTNWPLYLMVLVLVPLLLRRFFIGSDEESEGMALAFGVPFIIVCLAVSAIADRKCNDGSGMYPRSALQFGECLTYFLTEIGQTPDNLGHCSVEKVGGLAHELLVRKIKEFIRIERTPFETRLRMQDYAEYLESFRRDYKEAHRYLLDLGLVRPNIDKYFKEAESQLAD